MHRSLLVLLCALLPHIASAQAPNIRPWLTQIANGYSAEAKKALPDLLIDFPDDPAVLFLHASLVDEPKRAIPLYERIQNAYPKSEWADDALLRVIFHCIDTKETEKARRTWITLRDQYASSELVPVAYDALRMTIGAPAPNDKAPASTVKKESQKETMKDAGKEAVKEAQKPDDVETSKEWFTLQTMSTTDKTKAETQLAQLKKKRLKAKLATAEVKGKPKYMVQVGEYTTLADARKDSSVVAKICKCSPSIIKR